MSTAHIARVVCILLLAASVNAQNESRSESCARGRGTGCRQDGKDGPKLDPGDICHPADSAPQTGRSAVPLGYRSVNHVHLRMANNRGPVTLGGDGRTLVGLPKTTPRLQGKEGALARQWGHHIAEDLLNPLDTSSLVQKPRHHLDSSHSGQQTLRTIRVGVENGSQGVPQQHSPDPASPDR